MTVHLDPITLAGDLVRLEPLERDHHDALVDAATDGRLWELWYTSVPAPDGMAAEIDRRLGLHAAGQMLPFTAIRQADDHVLGMTTYMRVDLSVPRVEIGSTWTRASAQRTGTNTESKLLLLAHAFDVLGCEVVQFQTSWSNQQSRTAIARLGAKQDGVLRADRRHADGSLGDSVVFSIVAAEWPTVRHGLELRLAKHRT